MFIFIEMNIIKQSNGVDMPYRSMLFSYSVAFKS